MKKEKNNQDILDSIDYLSISASTTDCTGLIPAPAQTPSQREAYEELYHFLPPHTNKKDAE